MARGSVNEEGGTLSLVGVPFIVSVMPVGPMSRPGEPYYASSPDGVCCIALRKLDDVGTWIIEKIVVVDDVSLAVGALEIKTRATDVSLNEVVHQCGAFVYTCACFSQQYGPPIRGTISSRLHTNWQ